MTIRVFRCLCCGHRMKLDHTRCGSCCQNKSIHQKPKFYVWVTSFLFVGVVMMI